MPEGLRGHQRWILIPHDNVKFFHVSGEEDAMKLPTKKLPVYEYTSGPQQSDEFAFFNLYVAIDFPKLAQLGYDGLHLTKEGASFFEHTFVYHRIGFDFWDCESTVWFNTRWIARYYMLEI